jgi:hypothetical protein
VVSSAINGTPLNEDTLSTALSSALITAGTAQAANNIGAATQNGTLNAYTQAMAHALAGCVGGAATTGNSGGCSAGAVGAVVGELTMKFATGNQLTDSNALKLATSMSAVAGALVGGSSDISAVNVASQMGTNAALNNFCKGQINCENRRFTFSDAVAHWQSGNGTPITDVDASELNLKGATFTKVSDGVYLVHTSLAYDTGAIYGTVTGFLNLDGTMSFKPDTYNFDLKGYSDVNSMAAVFARTQRNALTAAGLLVNGVGDSYNIYFKGSIPAPVSLPK